jgi:chromosome segregation ATPase
MRRTQNITYPSVAEVCHQLLAIGEKPSIRNICDRIGGSFSTIQGFLQTWQEQQRLANKASMELSEPFHQALLAEFSRISEAARQQFQEQLQEQTAQLEEIKGRLAESETQTEELNQCLLNQQQASAQHQLALEKELAIAKALVEESTKRETALQNQVDTLRQSLHSAETKAAVGEAHQQEAEKHIQRLEKELQEMKKSG